MNRRLDENDGNELTTVTISESPAAIKKNKSAAAMETNETAFPVPAIKGDEVAHAGCLISTGTGFSSDVMFSSSAVSEMSSVA